MTDTKDREALAVLDSFYQAWADNDADAFVASHTEDPTLDPVRLPQRQPRRPSHGFAGPLKGSQVRDEVQNVRQAEGGDSRVAAASADQPMRHPL
jgi:hypothetical protein